MVRETTEELKTKIEEEERFILGRLKDGILPSFDMRDHVFQTVARDVCLKEESVKRVCFMHDVGIYHSTDNVLIRIAIGKKWGKEGKEGGYDYDYDDSLMSSIIMRNIMLSGGDISLLPSAWCEYKISYKDIKYRGDTMNSWSTTLNEYLRCFGGGDDGYFPSLEINKEGKNKGKWRITEEDPARDWVDFLSIPANYGKALPPYITEFLRVVYTIGNFIPVPKAPTNFNTGRNNACQDYWDLTLLAIYNYYHGESNTDKWESLLKKSKDWLGESTAENAAKNWDAFVRKNYLQDFVNAKDGTDGAEVPDGGHFGKPKELWTGHFEGHFKGNNLPSTEEEFRSFFTNAAAWIMARGTRMMIALEEKMAEQKNSREDA